MLINNTIIGSSHGGVFCNSTAAPTIKNNIVVDCDYGIRNEGGPAVPPDLSYNDVWDCADLYQSCPDTGPGAISADPRFAGDYRLAADSPCRDAGDPDPLFNDPDWTRNDMGWRYFPAPIGVDDARGGARGLESPGVHLAGQSFPNPFNPTTSIRFHLDAAAHVDLAIYNARGERVRTLADGGFTSGGHRIRWDGTDGHGNAVASGVYFFLLRAGSAVDTGRMTLVK
jgi:parallel beta-helix repeat protein